MSEGSGLDVATGGGSGGSRTGSYAVIAKLGMPTSESMIAGKKVYVWITQNFVEGTPIQMSNPGDHERRCCWIIRWGGK
jgi:hypothetical protein